MPITDIISQKNTLSDLEVSYVSRVEVLKKGVKRQKMYTSDSGVWESAGCQFVLLSMLSLRSVERCSRQDLLSTAPVVD